MNDKVLVITDSLGLPRAEPEHLLDEDCWTHKLSKLSNIDVYHYMRGGYATRNLRKDLNAYLKGYRPNIVLLQIGIVDCAPRAMGRLELKLISKIPVISTMLHYLIKKYRAEIIKRRKITYTTPSNFESNLLKVKTHFKDAEIIALPIAPANYAYIAHSPGIEDNITEYNKILSSLFNVIDPYSEVNPEDIFMSDHHHINKYGHSVVFDKLSVFFSSYKD